MYSNPCWSVYQRRIINDTSCHSSKSESMIFQLLEVHYRVWSSRLSGARNLIAPPDGNWSETGVVCWIRSWIRSWSIPMRTRIKVGAIFCQGAIQESNSMPMRDRTADHSLCGQTGTDTIEYGPLEGGWVQEVVSVETLTNSPAVWVVWEATKRIAQKQ